MDQDRLYAASPYNIVRLILGKEEPGDDASVNKYTRGGSALRSWRDLGLAWDEALAGVDMALLLDPTDPWVRANAEAAREILVRLEAAPFIARLDAALARPADPRARAAAPSAASVSTS